MDRRLSYSGKVMLAPMVRIGTLPTRLLALRYGADIVYAEELIDHKVLLTKRIPNPVLGTVDFVLPTGKCLFRTCEEEKDRLVFQMGTSDAARAVAVAELVKEDVSGIDVNMGCPKEFSVKGGMGAALLTQPERVKEILESLVEKINKPITCKIRILEKEEDTLSLVRLIESTGVSAIAVHGRLKGQRSITPVNCDILRKIAKHVKVPVIANGGSLDVTDYKDILAFRESSGCSSVMIARAAEHNPSVFRSEGPLPVEEVAREYVKVAIEYDAFPANVKYCLAQILVNDLETPLGRKLLSSNTLEDVCEAFGLSECFRKTEDRRAGLIHQLSSQESKALGYVLEVKGGNGPQPKRRKIEPEVSEDGTLELHVKYNRKDYPTTETPKSILHEYVKANGLGQLQYYTRERKQDRTFKSTVFLDGNKYSSTYWASSKTFAEQGSAEVVLLVFGEHNEYMDGTKVHLRETSVFPFPLKKMVRAIDSCFRPY